MAILEPFRNLLNPGTNQIPLSDLSIDWSHQLAQGLIGCWVPGVMGGVDVAGIGPTLTQGVGAVTAMTPEGPGMKFAADNCGLTGLATPPYKSFGMQMSLFWRGMPTAATGGNFVPFIEISFNNVNTTPFSVLGLITATTGNAFKIDAEGNTGGTSVSFPSDVSTASYSANIMQSLGISCDFNANGPTYINGVADKVLGLGSGAPTTSATSKINIGQFSDYNNTSNNLNAICTIACIWTRQLTADEQKWLHYDPYAFLIPAMPELIMLQAPVVPTTLFAQACM